MMNFFLLNIVVSESDCGVFIIFSIYWKQKQHKNNSKTKKYRKTEFKEEKPQSERQIKPRQFLIWISMISEINIKKIQFLVFFKSFFGCDNCQSMKQIICWFANFFLSLFDDLRDLGKKNLF